MRFSLLPYVHLRPKRSASLKQLGEKGHTTVTQLLSAFVYTVRGAFVNESAMWGIMPLNYYAETRLATTRALATNMAVATGKLGKGEFGGTERHNVMLLYESREN